MNNDYPEFSDDLGFDDFDDVDCEFSDDDFA